MRAVGSNVRRKDADAKVTGAAKYIDDLSFPGMLHGRTIRSTIPRGRLNAIRLDFDTAGFTVVDYRDVPGRNIVALIDDDQPCLAEHEVYHFAEPILLLAHADRDRLFAGAACTSTTRRSRRCSIPSARRDRSRTSRSTKAPSTTVSARRRRRRRRVPHGHQEQLYIETNGVIAVPESDGMTVYGSMQCPYYVHRALTVRLGLPAERVRVVQTETGGGFGGKEEYPSHIACHAALLARKARRPVKLIYDRVEDMVATTKRHPSIVRHRTGLMRDGRLVAMDIEVVLDGGAYCTLSPVVLSRGVIHASGPIAARTCASAAARCGRTRRPTARSAASARRRRSLRSKCTWIASPSARHRSGEAARDERAAARATRPRPARSSPKTRARSPC